MILERLQRGAAQLLEWIRLRSPELLPNILHKSLLKIRLRIEEADSFWGQAEHWNECAEQRDGGEKQA